MSLIIPPGPWAHGWGVPMATDTAFAVALIVMMGSRVPVELRIFLTAAAIVDDIGAIVVVAVFYSGAAAFRLSRRRAAVDRRGCSRCSTARASIACSPMCCSASRCGPACMRGGLHATLAGVMLALFIPTRPPPNLQRADDAGEHDPRGRGAARRRSAAARAVAAGAARARRHPRSAGIARRPPAAPCRRRARAISCCRCSRWPTPASC